MKEDMQWPQGPTRDDDSQRDMVRETEQLVEKYQLGDRVPSPRGGSGSRGDERGDTQHTRQ